MGELTQSTKLGWGIEAKDRRGEGRLFFSRFHDRKTDGLTGEEELGNDGSGSSLDDIVWLQ